MSVCSFPSFFRCVSVSKSGSKVGTGTVCLLFVCLFVRDHLFRVQMEELLSR